MKHKPYPAYKDSGVEWLGAIPEHWEVKPLFSLMAERKEKNANDSEKKVLSLSYGNILERNVDSNFGLLPESFNTYQIVNPGNIILRLTDLQNDKRSLRVGLSNERGIITSAYVCVKCRDNIDSRYAYSLLHSYDLLKVFYSYGGGVRQSMKYEDLKRLPIILPPLIQQNSIATFLDRETSRLDELISKKQRQIELLQEKRCALISQVVTKGLDPDVKMKDSGVEWLGKIPAHWELVPLKFTLRPCGDAVKTGPFGSQLLSSEMLSGSIKVYNQRNVLDRDFISGENYITEDKFKDLSAFTIFAHDVLVTTRGTIGRCAVFPQNAEKGILHPCLMRIEPNASLSPAYLSLLIQDGEIVLLQLRLMSNATTIDVIYSESLKSVRLPLPPIDEQRAIMAFLDRETSRIEQLIDKVSRSIDLLREYRTALISAAVTGKIDVREEVA